jgi:hypothetical protein
LEKLGKSEKLIAKSWNKFEKTRKSCKKSRKP